MTSISFRKAPNALPLRYQTVRNTANNTAQFDLSFNPTDAMCSLLMTCLAINIITTGTTVIQVQFDGVLQFSYTITNTTAQLIFSGPALFATAPNQTLNVRLTADASRTQSVCAVTVAQVVS